MPPSFFLFIPLLSRDSTEFVAKEPFYKKPVFWLGTGVVVYILGNIEVVPLSGRLRFRLVPSIADDYFAKKYDRELMKALGSRFLPHTAPVHNEGVKAEISFSSGEIIILHHTHTHTHIYIYIYIYTRTHTHTFFSRAQTHIHTHTHTISFPFYLYFLCFLLYGV